MELPAGPTGEGIFGFSSSVSFRCGFDSISRKVNSDPPEKAEQSGAKVHVAVGKKVGKAVALLRWTLRQFVNEEICVLHVHQPSPTIPTLLGKLPASHASSEVISEYRRVERQQMQILLSNYLKICGQSKVKASVIVTEASEVKKGIVDLVKKHGIRKLVMGAVPENCKKVRKSSRKASYAVKNAPCFCEIWFVNKDKHVWTREAHEGPSLVEPISQDGSTNGNQDKAVHIQVALSSILFSPMDGCDPIHSQSLSSRTGIGSSSGYTSFAEHRVSSDSLARGEEESIYALLTEIEAEAKLLRKIGEQELPKRENLEANAMEANSKVKALETACANEIKLRKEVEENLKTTIHEQENLWKEREELMEELHKAMKNIALLDSRAQEVNRWEEEACGELTLIQASIAALHHEKQKIQRQKMEATHWLDHWRNHGQGVGGNYNGLSGLREDSPKLAEFSLADLQNATCNFSESFILGQGGNGCVYKGEMLDQTVAIKKLHLHNTLGHSEFQQEVQVLGKLQHPHLVTLIGACPEACALVYAYLPNGSLQDRLLRRSNICSLTWKIRAQIIAEIAGGLLFLHSSKPEKIVHGNLKPGNILLDSDLSCKISEFGICKLISENTLRCPSFRQYTEPKGAFPYLDPEFHRTGALTPKSDIYSFGLIILQLLTGRAPVGLAGEVRKAVSCGRLASILDPSAGEWPNFVSKRLTDIGLLCCERNGKDRPDLTPRLVRELEQLCELEERPIPSFFLCPILQEVMHDPQVAADGFTYEGEALQGWLENGRETSPMTNLKLDHLHLTPNHALRQAIQDWLCKSSKPLT
ncbi:Non-specific serine/threonine protein kinase [Bertholletia excelsa]